MCKHVVRKTAEWACTMEDAWVFPPKFCTNTTDMGRKTRMGYHAWVFLHKYCWYYWIILPEIVALSCQAMAFYAVIAKCCIVLNRMQLICCMTSLVIVFFKNWKSLSVSLSVSVCLCLSLSLSVPLCLSLSLSVSVSLSVCLSLCPSFSLKYSCGWARGYI